MGGKHHYINVAYCMSPLGIARIAAKEKHKTKARQINLVCKNPPKLNRKWVLLKDLLQQSI